MRLLACAFLLALAACDGAGPLATDPALLAGGLRLDADQTAYDNRDTVHLTLSHTGRGTYWSGVLECAVLERWDGQAWTLSPSGNDRGCIMIAVEVAPGSTQTASVPLQAPDGSYRFTHTLSRDGASVTVATAAFRVE